MALRQTIANVLIPLNRHVSSSLAPLQESNIFTHVKPRVDPTSKNRNMTEIKSSKVTSDLKNIAKIKTSVLINDTKIIAGSCILKGQQSNEKLRECEVEKAINKFHASMALKSGLTSPHLASIESTRCNSIISKQFSTSPIGDMKHAFVGPADSRACSFDIVVVGAGIVGTATARKLSIRYPTLKLALIEKECAVALHQSDHNSGVIHAGIYYPPRSIYAKTCVRGCELMYQYCAKKNIKHFKCGKIIVAVHPRECPELLRLYKTSLINKVVGIRMIGEKEIREIEPNCLGIRALHSPNTGCVFYKDVTESLAQDFVANGGRLFFNFRVEGFGRNMSGSECHRLKYPLCLYGGGRCISAKYAVVCAGLYADRLALKMGCKRDPLIIPIRGTFMELKPQYSHLVKGNIYPVTHPDNPFPGVHFTKRPDGNVFCGPSAILALHRQGYKWYKFNPRDCADMATYGGCYKLACNLSGSVWKENITSLNRLFMVRYLRKYIPTLKARHLRPTAPGVAAIGVTETGHLEKDLVMEVPKVKHGMDEIIARPWQRSHIRRHHLLSTPHRDLLSNTWLCRGEPPHGPRERYYDHFRRYNHPRRRRRPRRRPRRRYYDAVRRPLRFPLAARYHTLVSRSRRTRWRASRRTPPERQLQQRRQRRRVQRPLRSSGGPQRRYYDRMRRHRHRRFNREDRWLPSPATPLPPSPPSRLE